MAEENDLEHMVCYPLSAVEYIDDAACLIHGMISNGFPAGAYHYFLPCVLLLYFLVPERGNVDYPFLSASITEFWRRWHKSLGSWFRDYVYLPLGGNRVGRRQMVNILLVWFLTGFWRGAEWNFLLWGFYFGILLILEKWFFMNGFIMRQRFNWLKRNSRNKYNKITDTKQSR